jgi:aminoglycoside phosphotransferase (APT) family kinase protein
MSGVKIGPVRDAHRFDQGALSDFMSANVPGFSGRLQVQQFDAGQSNPTFLVEAAGTQYVVRKKPPGQLLPKAHMVEREYRIMKALAQTEVPVPGMLALCEDESVIGTTFFVMEYLRGRVFWDASFPKLGAGERRSLYAETNRVLATLHKLDYESIGLGDYGRPGNYFERQVSRWTRNYQAAETEILASMNALMEWLPQNIPEDDSVSIAH